MITYIAVTGEGEHALLLHWITLLEEGEGGKVTGLTAKSWFL
jgi:hypothetical protein